METTILFYFFNAIISCIMAESAGGYHHKLSFESSYTRSTKINKILSLISHRQMT
jgi:hypothetical protein